MRRNSRKVHGGKINTGKTNIHREERGETKETRSARKNKNKNNEKREMEE